MTADGLTALEKLLAAATAAPWHSLSTPRPMVMGICIDVQPNDAQAIAALRNSAPELIRLARVGIAAVVEERARFAWLELAETHFPNRNDEVIAAEGALWMAKNDREALARKLAAEKEQGK